LQPLPDPAAVAEQKDRYMRSLEEQLLAGTATLEEQRRQQAEYLCQQAEQQKRQAILQIDQEMQQKELALQQQYHQQLLLLQQSAMQQKSALERQATKLMIEYEQQKMQEELRKAHSEEQRRFANEMLKLHPRRDGGSYVAPPALPLGGRLPSTASYVAPPATMPSAAASYVAPPAMPITGLRARGAWSYVAPPILAGLTTPLPGAHPTEALLQATPTPAPTYRAPGA